MLRVNKGKGLTLLISSNFRKCNYELVDVVHNQWTWLFGVNGFKTSQPTAAATVCVTSKHNFMAVLLLFKTFISKFVPFLNVNIKLQLYFKNVSHFIYLLTHVYLFASFNITTYLQRLVLITCYKLIVPGGGGNGTNVIKMWKCNSEWHVMEIILETKQNKVIKWVYANVNAYLYIFLHLNF